MSRLGQLVLLALALSAAGAYAAVRNLAIPSRPRLSGRIVGGAPANITQYPWQLYFITGGYVHTVKLARRHDYYNGHDYDIGVLSVLEHFVFGPGVQVITVSWNETAVGSPATVAGWGASSSDGSLPSELRAINIEIIDTAMCNATYGNLTRHMICAGVSEGGKDVCVGDEGSPLMSGSTQVGIVSASSGCGLPGYPGIYTYIFPLRYWIHENAGV
ncbi:trypsin alpha-3-like [Schistocerca serialis cubense]|uniref:trypsin alpha-3-like n=1 Tax=Schistocerca serialis cubense TaxID=2023355 RepID=UPI00214E2587|nr:trypsin alpha-3-like [Schistocerca serialis cubense]